MRALLTIIICLVTVAPFVPYTHLLSNWGLGDIAVVMGLLMFAWKYRLSRRLVAYAMFPVAIGFLGLVSLLFHMLSGSISGTFSEIGYVARWVYFGLLVLFVAVAVLHVDQASRAVLNGILCGVLITAIWSWVVWFQAPRYISGLPMMHVIEGSEWVVNRNYIGYFLGVGVVLSFSLVEIEVVRARRVALFILFLFLAFSALVSMSKGAWLSAFGPIFGYALSRMLPKRRFRIANRGRGAALGLGVLIIALIFATDAVKLASYTSAIVDRIDRSGDTNSERIQFVEDAISVISSGPLLGVGPQRYREAAIEEGLTPTDDPHNAVLWVGAELGLPAAILVSAVLVLLAILLYYKLGAASSSAWLPLQMMYVSIMLQVPLQGLPISGKHLWVLFGLVVGMRSNMSQIKFRRGDP